MAVNVVPYIGAGTRADPYRPLGSEQPGWKAIRFVPGGADGDRLNQFAIIVTPDEINDARARKICDILDDNMSQALRRAMEQATTVDMASLDRGYEIVNNVARRRTQSRAIDAIATALMRPPSGGWNPLVPSQLRGKYEIVLGGLERWFIPVIQGGASDAFTRANETPLAGNWTTGYGSWDNFNLVSNMVRAASNLQDAGARWNADTFGANHYSQADLDTEGSSNDAQSVCVRMHPSSTTNESCYALTNFNNNGTPEYHLYEVSSNFTWTSLDQVNGNTAAATFRLEVDGSTLTPKRNGTAISGLSATDTTLDGATFTRVGINSYHANGTLPRYIDNWQGNSLSVTTPIAAVLTGAGDLSAAQKATLKLASAMSGTGGQTIAQRAILKLATTMAGNGDLSATPTLAKLLAATMTGAGDLSGVLTAAQMLAATLAGNGDLSATMVPRRLLATTLTGAGNLSAAQLAILRLASTMAGNGDLSAAMIPRRNLASTMVGNGDLSAVQTPLRLLAAQMAGAGDLTASQLAILRLASLLTGNGDLSGVLEKLTDQLRVIMTGSGNLSASLQSTLRLSTSMSGSGDLSAVLRAIISLITTLEGVGALTATQRAELRLASQMVGTGDLAGALLATQLLAAQLTGLGTLVARFFDIPEGIRQLAIMAEYSELSDISAIWTELVDVTAEWKDVLNIGAELSPSLDIAAMLSSDVTLEAGT